MSQIIHSIRSSKVESFVKETLIALSFSCLLALSAQFSVTLPFSPVPMSMQGFAVLLMGALLGSRRTLFAVIAYLAEGTCGLPVFAGGLANPLWMIGPRAGYLIGFAVAGFLTGKLLENRAHVSFVRIALSFAAGSALILFCGWLWLSLFGGASYAFTLGVLPFIIGDAVKILSASLIVKGIYK